MPNCFIIMPITTPKELVQTYGGDKDHFVNVLEHLFVPAIQKADLNPVRPIAEGQDLIHERIITNVEKAGLVLCDMSTLNPNVFFELGIRTAVNKRVCMVKDDKTPKIPFDTGLVNCHTYDPSLSMVTGKEQIESLAEHIKKVLDAEDLNPLWERFSLAARAEFTKAQPGQDPRMELVLEKVDSIAARMDGRAGDVPPPLDPKEADGRVDEILAAAEKMGCSFVDADYDHQRRRLTILCPGHRRPTENQMGTVMLMAHRYGIRVHFDVGLPL